MLCALYHDSLRSAKGPKQGRRYMGKITKKKVGPKWSQMVKNGFWDEKKIQNFQIFLGGVIREKNFEIFFSSQNPFWPIWGHLGPYDFFGLFRAFFLALSLPHLQFWKWQFVGLQMCLCLLTMHKNFLSSLSTS